MSDKTHYASTIKAICSGNIAKIPDQFTQSMSRRIQCNTGMSASVGCWRAGKSKEEKRDGSSEIGQVFVHPLWKKNKNKYFSPYQSQ